MTCQRLTRWERTKQDARAVANLWRPLLGAVIAAVVRWTTAQGQQDAPQGVSLFLQLGTAAILGTLSVGIGEFLWHYSRGRIREDRRELSALRAEVISLKQVPNAKRTALVHFAARWKEFLTRHTPNPPDVESWLNAADSFQPDLQVHVFPVLSDVERNRFGRVLVAPEQPAYSQLGAEKGRVTSEIDAMLRLIDGIIESTVSR